ncbi:MAG: murein transglycosylase A [Sphingomicrobium sp.]
MSVAVRAIGLAGALLLAGCATRPLALPPVPVPVLVTPVPAPAPAPVLDNAMLAGIQRVAPPPVAAGEAIRALAAFRTSCPVLAKREDKSGLTSPSDWTALCAEADAVTPTGAASFFHDRFTWVLVGKGEAFATGYYEPEIAGSRTRQPGYEVPIYSLPADLIRCTRADGGEGKGRIDETGQCGFYFDRAAIDDGALAGRGLELAWAADPVALFFVEIQGSGRLRLPDGGVMRIGFAGQNGREYVAIGRLLRERNLLPPGGATMAGIVGWIKDHPGEGRALMRENLSYIFFKELVGPGPLGALNVPVSPRASVAADPAFVPLGAPVFLILDRAEANGLWVAQDTGGAIKGANRFDTFWGAGTAAEQTAGGFAANGKALILLPPAAVDRALARR